MRIDEWIHDLPSRLELAGDVLNDLANSAWVASDGHRDRIFSVEAQVWRIAQTTRRTSGQHATLLPFLGRSLNAVRSNLRLCLRIRVCDEDEGIELLEGLVRDLDTAISDLEFLRLAIDEPDDEAGDAPDDEAGDAPDDERVDDEEPTWIRRVAGASS